MRRHGRVAGLVEGQAYAVMDLTVDAHSRSWVQLCSPLRAYAPDGNGGLADHANGSFSLPLDDVRRGFNTISSGLAGH